ncbi:outer membrane protein assembly factor BamB family protein [Singulisphaera rosea]
MTLIRSAVAILIFLPGLAFGQVKPDEVDKVSNDNPARPLQMPAASTEAKEALDDFDRFQRRGAWERALKSLFAIPDDQARRFVDGDNGFVISIARKRHVLLSRLPANGQAAFRVFYDAEARRLLEEAEGPSELANLERIYSAYFLTSVGDNAADRLGDLYYELGRFDRAAECWMAVLKERTDTDLSPALLTLKAALALSRAGRISEFEALRSELANRYRDDSLVIGGRAGSPSEQLRRLLESPSTETVAKSPSTSESATDATLGAGEQVDPTWQTRVAESIEAGMNPHELTQWESNPLSAAVPAVTIDGSSLYANYLGHVFAIDLKSGKMLWRSASFHNLEVIAMQDQSRMLDPNRFAIIASGDYVWSLGRDIKDQNFMAPFRLTCRRASSGEVVWQSSDLADYAQVDMFGAPLLVGDKIFVVGKAVANPQQQGLPQELLLAIQPHDGKLLWKTEVATFRQANQMYFYYYARDTSPLPRLVYRAGSMYLDTQVGLLARVDAESGTLDWGYGYRTDPSQNMGGRFFFGYPQQQDATTASSPPLPLGDAFLVKGAQSDRLTAVEPNQMKILWERPISKSARMLGADDNALFLGGPEVSAIDLKTRDLLWATRIPNGSLEGRVLVRPDGVWQLTPRGVFEIDPKSGSIRRIFRGKDLGSVGGDLYLTDKFFLTVSNRTISAYPRSGAASDAAGRDESSTAKEKASDEE